MLLIIEEETEFKGGFNMYITVKTIKRDLGFKGIELTDVIIGFPILTICILMFSLTTYKIEAIILFIIGAFLLLPINVSKKNRMYKVLILVFNYWFRIKKYVYSNQKLDRERVVNLDEIKRKFKY